MVHEMSVCRCIDSGHIAIEAFRRSRQEMCEKQRNVVSSFSQRRDGKRDDIQPVIEVLTEVASLGGVTEVDLCCSHNPQIDRANLIRAEWSDFAHLKDAQQFHLRCCRHAFNFIEKQRATTCMFNPSEPLFLSSRESTCLVTEQFAFNHRFGQGPRS
jgi:hypothetical protein